MVIIAVDSQKAVPQGKGIKEVLFRIWSIFPGKSQAPAFGRMKSVRVWMNYIEVSGARGLSSLATSVWYI